jgi:hypothetical protein
MKYENLFKIYIPEPCHEDWDKMTPNEQGAFCKVCAKTVVDFSDRTENEIQKFLSDNINNKICGRFRVNQLDDNKTEEILRLKIEMPKFEFPGFLLPVLTPFRAYAMAMMLFASAALSSCGNSNEGGGFDDGRTVGIMIVEPDSSKQVDTAQYNFNNDRIQGGITIDRSRQINNTQNNNTDSTCNVDELRTVGKIKVKQNIDTVKADTTERMIKGEIEPVKKTHGVLIKKENEK